MMDRTVIHLVVLLEEEWSHFKSSQNVMLALLKNLGTDSKSSVTKNLSGYITAKEFMEGCENKESRI
jgi:hypothetical protein